MRISDIRKDDIVKFRAGILEEDKEKISKFARYISPNNKQEMKTYAHEIINPKSFFKVKDCKRTTKVPTEYAVIQSKEGVLVSVQTRYLELVERIAKHPLTTIFK